MRDSLRADTKKSGMKKSSLFIGLSLAVAVLLLVAAVFFILKSTNVVEPVALKVGEREVTLEQFNEYVRLGKATTTSEADVKKVVTEYEKKQFLAEKYDITIPEEYIALSRQDMLADAAFGTSGGSIDTLRTADDKLTKLRLYNTAFDTYVVQVSDGGTAIILYDIPIVASLEPKAAAESAIANAKDIREQIKEGNVSSVAAVKKAEQLNIGQPAQSGMYFIRSSDGAVLSRYGGGVYTRLLEPTLIQENIKNAKPGLTEVKQYQQLSAYFINVLERVEARKDLQANVETDMEKIKVVDYVK
ncbi:MAG: hypothetical protein UY35_C0024G0002 [Candidatus Saccharibacteria bacterium GW2011_GWC2_48_9]|nr:MAG: hypothetical protein UY35_C0024G0002 [Candidatus Saccharibacteria bacterium GW2011_GWC2_48_9]